MVTEDQVIARIVSEAQLLTPEGRLRLIQRVTETLLAPPAGPRRQLQYGKFQGGNMSTEEDFAIAEWRPSSEALS